MKKAKIILFIFLTVVVFWLTDMPAKAEGTCHINNCFVPAPTIVVPLAGETVVGSRPVIRGLTWKRTLVDIYLDGEYQGEVILREHENYLQSFFWQPIETLAPGQHFVYTIAYNSRGYDPTLKGWDQSKESTYIYFTVPQPVPVRQEVEMLPNESTEQSVLEDNLAESNEKTIIPEQKKADQKTATNVILEIEKQQLNKRNRIFGLSLAGIIILIIIVNYLIRKKKRELEQKINQTLKGERVDNEPPPPPPKNQDSLGI